MGQVTWSVQARSDLDTIVDHIAADSPSRAEAFHWDALRSSIVLGSHPRAGHPVPEVADPDIREIQFGNYRVIHWVKSEAMVVVLTIRHGKRRLPRGLVLGRKRSNR